MAANPLKIYLRNASGDAVKNDVAKLRAHLSEGHWVGINNIYTKSSGANIFKKRRDGSSPIKQRQVRDYVAASIFNHCGDGWSLLGRALALHIKGDANSSVHLAYYAELRAAMSLLAVEGIGVFNGRHVVVSNTGANLTPETGVLLKGLKISEKEKREIRGLGSTHKFVWMALEHWADRKLSAGKLSMIITPGSVSLADWFSAFDVDSSLGIVGSDWLKKWGIDIKYFGDDQNLRNHSSYRPTRMLPKRTTSAPDALSFLCELWRMCEPTPSSRFDEIDKHLLRISLSKAYKGVHGVDPKLSSNINKYKTWVENKIPTLGLDLSIQNQWVRFLTWQIQPDDSRIIHEAGQFSSVDDPNHHLQVLARAILLLRIATGISGALLRNVGFTRSDLDSWWQPYAVDHGLIDGGIDALDFLDLWDEVNVALQDVDLWRSKNPAPYSYNQLVAAIARPILRLSECERISLWGLGI